MTTSRLLDSALAQELSFMIARARSRSSARANRRLAELGLKVRSYSVLALACSDLEPTQRELADFLALDPSQIVSIADDLQERGLIRRETSAADRRSKVLRATAAGQELFDTAQALTAEAEEAFLEPLSPSERATLLRLLHRIAFSS